MSGKSQRSNRDGLGTKPAFIIRLFVSMLLLYKATQLPIGTIVCYMDPSGGIGPVLVGIISLKNHPISGGCSLK
jgi:hypothetical protein